MKSPQTKLIEKHNRRVLFLTGQEGIMSVKMMMSLMLYIPESSELNGSQLNTNGSVVVHKDFAF